MRTPESHAFGSWLWLESRWLPCGRVAPSVPVSLWEGLLCIEGHSLGKLWQDTLTLPRTKVAPAPVCPFHGMPLEVSALWDSELGCAR